MTVTAGQNLDELFDDPWYQGSSSSSTLVPAVLQVSIDGHPYIITPKEYTRITVPIQRQSTDESVEPGEQTLNVAGAWRRAQDNWFLGAGQEYLDNRFSFMSVYVHSGETPSVRTRFWRSKGVNPWTEGSLNLLPEYHKVHTTGASPIVCAVGTDLFVWDGTHLYVSDNPTATTPTFTAVTAPGGGTWPTVQSMTTDGANLYLALGSHGVAEVPAGETAASVMRLPAPTPTGGAHGTTGSTHYTYWVVAVDANGFKSLVSTKVAITDGNATLSTANYNEIGWTAIEGAVSYDVLKGTTGHSIATGLTTTSFTDDGSSSTKSYTAPTSTTDNCQATFVSYGNSFLIAGAGPLLASVGANGATTLVMKHFNPSFTWDAGCGSPVAIYAAGHAGNISELYGIQLSTQTYALGAPYIAGQVPYGEVIHDLCYYQGLVIMATSQGVRAAQDTQSNGHLTNGPVITDLGESLCLVPYGAYVWFGLTAFNEDDGIWSGTGVSSGTGRLFLSEFSSTLLPAYTSDVLASDGVTGKATSVTVCQGTIFFAIETGGVWGPDGNVVEEGYLESGWVRYGTIETKILVATDVRHDALKAGQSVQIEVVPFSQPSFSTAASAQVGSTGPATTVSAGYYVGESFQIIPVLRRGTTATVGPVLHRWTCRAQVISIRQDQIIVPILWYEEVRNPAGDGVVVSMDLQSEWQFLKALEKSGRAFLYKEGGLTYTVQVDQVNVKPTKWNGDRTMLEGLLLVKLLTLN